MALSRNLSLVADYRYFKAFDISLSEEQPVAPANPTFAAARLRGSGDYENHRVMVGLRYSFGEERRAVPLK